MRFRNPQNGYEEKATTGWSWLWAFLWPPLYYAAKGIWTHAVVSFLLAWVLGGFSYGAAAFFVGIAYAIMNRGIVRAHYLKKGWLEVDGKTPAAANSAAPGPASR